MFGFYQRLNVHVLDCNVSLIRAIRRQLAPEALRDPALRAARKGLYRRMIAYHTEARALFTAYRF